MRLGLTVLVTAVIFLSLDMFWLGYLGKAIYIEKLGPLLRLNGNSIDANVPAAVIVYIALISGLVFLVYPLAGDKLLNALLYGAFFGFVTYATYDFTNLAVLQDWRWDIAIIDTLWGMVLCATTTVASLSVLRFLLK